MNLHLKNGDYSVPTIEPVEDYEELLESVDLEFPRFDPAFKRVRSLSGLVEKIKSLGEKEEFGETVKAKSYAYGFATSELEDSDEDICMVLRLTNLKKLTLDDISKSQLVDHISYESHIFELSDAQYLFEMVWED